MRFLLRGLVIGWLTWGALGAVAQEQTPSQPEQRGEAPARDQFFAGLVTALSPTEITVSRTVLGDKSSTRTFQITPETRIEGKPKVKSRVTVQYVGTEEGDRAIRVVVRTPAQKKQA